ncbi:MAG: hypothetical protein PVJ61_07995 [Dehalococcoidia bacterium]|jgi:hypothetical protein
MTPAEAYQILLQRQINEDRIVVERTNMFLLATAFLFVAFVTLLDPDMTAPIIELLRIILPIVGIFLAFLLFCFNQSASIALTFWHIGQRKIEEEAAEFDYMRSYELTPHIDEDAVMNGEKEWGRDKANRLILVPVAKPKRWWQKRLLRNKAIYRIYIPLTFVAIWVASLVVAIVS